jgi:arsenate reductase
MGCGDACPTFPGKSYLDWKLDEPLGLSVETLRPMCDESKLLVEGVIAEFAPEPAA